MIDVQTLCSKGIAIGALTAFGLTTNPVVAADHQEAPGARAQLAADIGDYYVWHEDNFLNLVLTFGTFATPELPASFNRDLLYGFHFDTSIPADGLADANLYARFAQDTAGNWGLQIFGLGESTLVAPVESVASNGEFSAWAGVADDPFFFDQTGFIETVTTGTLSFDPNRDDVAGLNVTALAVQIPIESILSGGSTFQTWTTTSSM